MVSVDVVGLDRVFVEGDVISNKYSVRIVKLSYLQRLVGCFIDNQIVIRYKT